MHEKIFHCKSSTRIYNSANLNYHVKLSVKIIMANEENPRKSQPKNEYSTTRKSQPKNEYSTTRKSQPKNEYSTTRKSPPKATISLPNITLQSNPPIPNVTLRPFPDYPIPTNLSWEGSKDANPKSKPNSFLQVSETPSELPQRTGSGTRVTNSQNWLQKLLDAGWTEADLYYNNFPRTEEEYLKRLENVIMSETELKLVYMNPTDFLIKDDIEWQSPMVRDNRIVWYRKIRKAQNKFFKQMGILTDAEVNLNHPPKPHPVHTTDDPSEADTSNQSEVHIFIDPETLNLTREDLAYAERRAELRAKVDACMEDDGCDVDELVDSMRDENEEELKRLKHVKAKRVEEWVQDNFQNLNEIEKVRDGLEKELHQIVEVHPKEYLNLLLEIAYYRQQVREKRKKKRKLMIEYLSGLETLKEDRKWAKRKELFSWNLLKRQNYIVILKTLADWGSRMVGFFGRRHLFHEFWKIAGFYSPGFAIVFHNMACFTTSYWTILGLVIEPLDTWQLRNVTSWREHDDNIVLNRTLTLASQIIVLIAAMCGLIGSYFQETRLMFLYVLLFLIGWCIFTSDVVNEHSFAEQDQLETFLLSQVMEYSKNVPYENLGFLMGAQQQFECCGAHGPKDYGNKENLAPGEKFHLPVSCCLIDTYQYKAKGLTECYINDDPEVKIFVNFQGCFKPVRAFLSFLHEQKQELRFYYILATILTILSFIAYCNQFFTKWLIHEPKEEKEIPLAERLMDFLEAEEENTTEDYQNQLAHAKTVRESGHIITKMMLKLPSLQVADPYEMAETMIGFHPRSWWKDLTDPKAVVTTLEPSISLERSIQNLELNNDFNPSEIHIAIDLCEAKQNELHPPPLPKVQYPLPHPVTRVARHDWGLLTKNTMRTSDMKKDHQKAHKGISESVRNLLIHEVKLREAQKLVQVTERLAKIITIAQRGFFFSRINDNQPASSTRPLYGGHVDANNSMVHYDRGTKYQRFYDRINRCRNRFRARLNNRAKTELASPSISGNESVQLASTDASHSQSRLSSGVQLQHQPSKVDIVDSTRVFQKPNSISIQTGQVVPQTVDSGVVVAHDEVEEAVLNEEESMWTIAAPSTTTLGSLK